MWTRLFRALAVTAAATASVAWVLGRLDRPEPARSAPAGPPEIDADAMSSIERDALLRELEAQL